MSPLSRHVDGGFGAIGDAYKRAADNLDEPASLANPNGHLPVNFLRRHAIELFLKSMIMVLHRCLSDPQDERDGDAMPEIQVDGRSTPLSRIHRIQALFDYFMQLATSNRDRFLDADKTDWAKVPSELAGWIAAIERADASSTFFRYPEPPNRAAVTDKSAWREVHPEDIDARLSRPGRSPTGLFILMGEDECVRLACAHEGLPLQELSLSLKQATEMLSGAHIGLRAELAGGW